MRLDCLHLSVATSSANALTDLLHFRSTRLLVRLLTPVEHLTCTLSTDYKQCFST